MSKQDDAKKLDDAINQNDQVFMDVDDAIRAYAEDMGLNPDDFEWTVDVVAK